MIEKLKNDIDTTDFTFRKIVEGENYYVYQQCTRDTDFVVGYEVFKKKTRSKEHQKRFVGMGSMTQEKYDNLPDFKEIYPKDEDFGKWAWTFPTEELATRMGKSLAVKSEG